MVSIPQEAGERAQHGDQLEGFSPWNSLEIALPGSAGGRSRALRDGEESGDNGLITDVRTHTGEPRPASPPAPLTELRTQGRFAQSNPPLGFLNSWQS